jgi:predicted DNA-binding antitoxin AbrB/MazE fold protein
LKPVENVELEEGKEAIVTIPLLHQICVTANRPFVGAEELMVEQVSV